MLTLFEVGIVFSKFEIGKPFKNPLPKGNCLIFSDDIFIFQNSLLLDRQISSKSENLYIRFCNYLRVWKKSFFLLLFLYSGKQIINPLKQLRLENRRKVQQFRTLIPVVPRQQLLRYESWFVVVVGKCICVPFSRRSTCTSVFKTMNSIHLQCFYHFGRVISIHVSFK